MGNFPKDEIEELLKRIKGGDETAFTRLADLKSGNLHNLAYSYLHDEMLAEDVVQDVFCQLIKNCKSFKNEDNLNGWLNSVAINKSLNILNKRKNEVFIADASISDIVNNEHCIERMYIRECLSMLDENERQALQLHNHGYVIREMAEIMNLTFKQARVLLNKAKNKFIKIYKK